MNTNKCKQFCYTNDLYHFDIPFYIFIVVLGAFRQRNKKMRQQLNDYIAE